MRSRPRPSKPHGLPASESKESLFNAALQSVLEKLPSAEAMVSSDEGRSVNGFAIAHDALLLGTGPLMASLHRMLTLPMDSTSSRATSYGMRI